MNSEHKSQVQPEAVHMEIRGIEDLECRPPIQSQCKRQGPEPVFKSRFSRQAQSQRIPDPGKSPGSHIVVKVIVAQGTEQEVVKDFDTDPVPEGYIGMDPSRLKSPGEIHRCVIPDDVSKADAYFLSICELKADKGKGEKEHCFFHGTDFLEFDVRKLMNNFILIHPQDQALQVFPLRMIDAHRMVGRL